jgi:hypothetical protein
MLQYIYIFSVVPTLEHMTSVKSFVSLQFLIHKTFGRTPWTRDQPDARPLRTQTQIKLRHPCLELHLKS